MSIAEFAKKVIDSARASGEGWPSDAVYKADMIYGDSLTVSKFFTSKEALDSYVDYFRTKWNAESFEARLEIFEWDLGPELISTQIFRKKETADEKKKRQIGVVVVALAAVGMVFLAKAGRR